MITVYRDGAVALMVVWPASVSSAHPRRLRRMAQRNPTGSRSGIDPVLWKTARWVIALIVFLAALATLLPMAVDATRALVELS